MATKKAAKEKGEWVSETIAEFNTSPSVAWKAQLSTSPDGKEFVGIRQYITTGKSGVLAGKGGITVMNDAKAEDFLLEIERLVRDLRVQISGEAKAQRNTKNNVKAKKAAQSQEEPQFLMVKNNGKYLKSVTSTLVTVTSNVNVAQLFSKTQGLNLLKARLSDAWTMKTYISD